MKKIFLILLSIIVFLSIASCGESTLSRYYGNSIYYDAIEVGDVVVAKRPDGYYQMVKFTDAAYSKEVVVIPSHINGKPLIGIGIFPATFVDNWGRTYRCDYYALYDHDNYAYGRLSPFKELNAKVIYIGAHHQNSRIFSKILESEKLEKVVSTSCDNFDFYDKYDPTCFHSETAMSVVTVKKHEDDVIANINFYINDSTNSLYWIDYETSENLIFEPPLPYRDGYEFAGWYKEPECINAWDFDNDKIEASNDENNLTKLNLYAKWK